MPQPPRPRLEVPVPWVVDELRLRLPATGDVDAITAAAQDEDVRRFTTLPTPYVRHDARDYVELAARALAEGTGVHLVVADRASDGFLGAFGLMLDWRDAIAELGYWLAPHARGRGVAKRAARSVVAFGFGLGLGRIWLQTAANNPASNALARSLGFVHEGTKRQAGIDGATGDRTAPRVDMELYGLLPGELV